LATVGWLLGERSVRIQTSAVPLPSCGEAKLSETVCGVVCATRRASDWKAEASVPVGSASTWLSGGKLKATSGSPGCSRSVRSMVAASPTCTSPAPLVVRFLVRYHTPSSPAGAFQSRV
jgi:hypothetical protein